MPLVLREDFNNSVALDLVLKFFTGVTKLNKHQNDALAVSVFQLMHRRDVFAILPTVYTYCMRSRRTINTVSMNELNKREFRVRVCLVIMQACQDKMGVFIGLFISRRITRQGELLLVNDKIPTIIETCIKPGGLFT